MSGVCSIRQIVVGRIFRIYTPALSNNVVGFESINLQPDIPLEGLASPEALPLVYL